MRQGLRSGEVVRLAVVTWLDQHLRRDGRNVANVNDADRRLVRTQVKGALGGDRRTQQQQALHEQVGPQERVRNFRVSNVSLDRGVIALEAAGGVLVRGELRELHDVLYARPPCSVDEV